MNAEHLSLASVSAPRPRPLSRALAARIAGHVVMSWRYDRLPNAADATLPAHYRQRVVDGWLQSGDLSASLDLWIDARILVAGDAAVRALCPDALVPRVAGAGILAHLDVEDEDCAETQIIAWHAAQAEEDLATPALRTGLAQMFDALIDAPVVDAATIKELLRWDALCARYADDNFGASLEQALAALRDPWPYRSVQERRTAAE